MLRFVLLKFFFFRYSPKYVDNEYRIDQGSFFAQTKVNGWLLKIQFC